MKRRPKYVGMVRDDVVILCCYEQVHSYPETIKAVWGLRNNYIVSLSEAVGVTDYYEHLAREWQACHVANRSLITIEHDVEVSDGLIDELLACEHDYCGYRYSMGTGYYTALGFTKFSASLISEYPTLMYDVGEIVDGSPKKHFERTDSRIKEYLIKKDKYCHEHRIIKHYNPKQEVKEY